MSNDHRFRGRLALRRALFAALTALLLVGIVSPQAWAWYQFHTAKREMARHHPAEARQALKKCERIWPSSIPVRFLASRAARQEGDLEDAIAELRECQRLSGGATEATAFEWALIQAAGGNVREVEEYLQKQAESSPEIGPLVWEALAEGYLRLYRTLDAMACLNHWLDRDHDNLRALELRGMTYVAGKGVQRGAEDFRKVLSIDPDRKQTRMRLTACLLDLGSYDEAAENLEWSLRQSPGDPDIIARLARCYFMLKRGAEGRRLVEDALKQHPDHGLCLRTLGQFDLSEGRRAEAELALQRAVVQLPNDYQSHWLLFQALQQQGKLDEAKEQLKRAEMVRDRNERLGELTSRKLAENPLDPGIHYEFGTILMRDGRTQSALQWFDSALSLDPNHRPTHAALADYYEKNGDKLKAEEHRKKANAPENPPR